MDGCETRLYSCRQVAGDPSRWREADWLEIPPAGPFILASGAGPAQLQTEVRAVWTDEALHVDFRCEDPLPWATMTRRDADLYEEEVVELFLAPQADRTGYFEFEINPLGTLFDAEVRWHCRGLLEVRRGWNCRGLTGAAAVLAGGWQARLAIPFAGLRARPTTGAAWAANFYRIERRPLREFSSWAPLFTDPPEFHLPERFGRLILAGRAR